MLSGKKGGKMQRPFPRLCLLLALHNPALHLSQLRGSVLGAGVCMLLQKSSVRTRQDQFTLCILQSDTCNPPPIPHHCSHLSSSYCCCTTHASFDGI
uniref:Uncharacterized protein n=1 Tax=Meleagris gallopavo TaxID=9103 RepID=A0A803YAM6_MELGA